MLTGICCNASGLKAAYDSFVKSDVTSCPYANFETKESSIGSYQGGGYPALGSHQGGGYPAQ